jgi:hypothetical protein
VKIVKTVLLIFAMIGSLALPIFFLAVRHFHLEEETAQWMMSVWPRTEIPLEDRRAAVDMLITYGELAGANMLAYTAIGWCGVFVYRRFVRRAGDESVRVE